LLDKWKTVHPALTQWQPRHANEARQLQADIKAKIVIEASKTGTDEAPVIATWAFDDTLLVSAHDSVAPAVAAAVDALMQSPLAKDHRLATTGFPPTT